jgi:hypothetical protein
LALIEREEISRGAMAGLSARAISRSLRRAPRQPCMSRPGAPPAGRARLRLTFSHYIVVWLCVIRNS